MIAPSLVYLLCAAASVLCASVLLLKYRSSRVNLLFWSGICFVGFAVGNVLLFIDLVLLPERIDLIVIRTLPTLIGLCCLLWGLVMEDA